MSETEPQPETKVEPKPAPPVVPDRAKLFAALAKAQLEIKNVSKSREVRMEGRDGRPGRAYSYATLDSIIETIREPLAKNGLAIIQEVSMVGGDFILVTRLVHESGQEHLSRYPMHLDSSHMKAAQAFGSAVTYARRYSIQNMFLIAGDEDDDQADSSATIAQKESKKTPAFTKPAQPAAAPKTTAMKPAPTPAPKQPEPSPNTTGMSQALMDAKPEPNEPVKSPTDRLASREELTALSEKATKRGWHKDLCSRFITMTFNKQSSSQMTLGEVNSMMQSVETMTGFDATAMLDQLQKAKT